MQIGVYTTKLVGPNWIPKRVHQTDTGFDLKTAIDFSVKPGCNVKVPTGLVFDLPIEVVMQNGIPHQWTLVIEQRTGLAGRGLYPAATIVDAGYRPKPDDENGLTLSLFNVARRPLLPWSSWNTLSFQRGDKVMQARFVLSPIPNLTYRGHGEVTWNTDRGDKRFGATGR